MNPMLEALMRERLIIIARDVETSLLLRAAQALREAGIAFLELTFDHRSRDPIGQTVEKFRALRGAFGSQLRLGAGTVLTVEEARAAREAGCEYVVSPNTNERVVEETKRLGLLSIPGALTPTEICRAYELGADVVKLFPADAMGVHYIANLRGPLPHIPLMATGGVNPQTIPEFFRAGVDFVGTGVTVLRRDLLDRQDFAGIAALAREHLEAVRRAV